MKYAIKILQIAKENLREIRERALDSALDGALFSEVDASRVDVDEALDLIRAKVTASSKKKPVAAKKKKVAGSNVTASATLAAKKRGRPRRQLALDDATLDDDGTRTDPPPPMPLDAHPLDVLAGRRLDANGATP